MKLENAITSSKKNSNKDIQIVDLELEEGASILFAPTGEQWRILTIDDEQIVFEKMP